MAKMSRADFEFFKSKVFENRSFHEKRYTARINPKLLRSYYEGDPRKSDGALEDTREEIAQARQQDVRRVSFNKFFPSTATVTASLYPQNPKFIVTPRRTQIDKQDTTLLDFVTYNFNDEISAKVLQSAMNYYYKEMNAKHENQLAILNAWINGFGIIKQGWQFTTQRVKEVDVEQNDSFIGKAKQFMTGKAVNMDKRSDVNESEFIQTDGPFIRSVSPDDIYLDKTRPFGEGKIITQVLDKTLDEVINSKLYDTPPDLIEKIRTSDDDRKIKLKLFETWVRRKDGLFVFVMTDKFDQPLRWQKMDYMFEGFPFEMLRLNVEPKVTYPVSHLSVALKAQRSIDFLLTLQLEQIDRYKSQIGINSKALTKSGRDTLEDNKVGGVVDFKGPITPGDYVNLNTTSIPKDLFAMQDVLNANVQEILTVTGERQSGESTAKTATQAKIAELGNELRTSGMQDQIREFVIKQGNKLAQLLKQFATGPLLFKVTGLNLRDPEGNLVTDFWTQFGKEGAPTLKDNIQGEYDYDIDTTEVARKDLPVVRKQMIEALSIINEAAPLLQAEGVKFNAAEFVKKILANFETIGNVDQFFEKAETPPALPGPEGLPGAEEALPPELSVPSPGVPTPEAIERGAREVPIGIPQEGGF